MGGKEYEVLATGGSDPSSCLVYAPRHEPDTSDPLTLRLWKAEAKLARGDITISGYAENPLSQNDAFIPPVNDPLSQIAELKKRIQAIEERRVTLCKVDDPVGQILIQDNIVRPNKPFDIWAYTKSSPRIKRDIQYIKIRGIILAISASCSQIEHFLFNVSDQLQPGCRINDDTLGNEGRLRLDLVPGQKTIQGLKTEILNDSLGGRIELAIATKINCKYASGLTVISANINQAAYIREVKGPRMKINQLAFPEIGEHMIVIEGICLDIYTTASE